MDLKTASIFGRSLNTNGRKAEQMNAAKPFNINSCLGTAGPLPRGTGTVETGPLPSAPTTEGKMKRTRKTRPRDEREYRARMRQLMSMMEIPKIAALQYAELGFPVIPLHTIGEGGYCTCGKKEECESPGKHPRYHPDDLANGLKNATTDLAQIRRWWKRKGWEDSNIGVETGEKSFDALDIDRKDENGFETLEQLVQENGDLPSTLAQKTGSGGKHLYFSPNDLMKNRTRFAPGLDTKGNGGYAVLPPSRHESGGRYLWADGALESILEGSVTLMPMPGWLLSKIIESKTASVAEGKRRTIDPVNILKGVPEGERNDRLFRMACRYVTKGLKREEMLPIILEAAANCDPPLDQEEALRLTESALRYEPHPDEASDRPEESFPSEVISGLAGDFAELYSAHLEVPVEFLFMGFLTCLGTVLADRLTLASEVYPQPRLYLLVLGESADERKSTMLDKVCDFFKDALPDDFHACYGVGSPEGLQKLLKKKNKLVLVLDEFKAFVSKCRIMASVLLPCVNTLFESNRYENRTKTTDISLDDAYLSMMAASTVQTYNSVWSSQFTDIGFNNRLWLVPGRGERKFPVPRKVPLQERGELERRLRGLVDSVGDETEMEIAGSALKMFEEWYLNQEKSVHSKRLDTYALRFMPLLAVNELKGEVDDEIVQKVIRLVDWQLQVRQIHDPIDADNEIAKMEEAIRRVLRRFGPQREWQLKDRTAARKKGLWVYSTARKNLYHAKEIGHDKKSKSYFSKV